MVQKQRRKVGDFVGSDAGIGKPALAATYPLSELVAAQTAFIAKEHSGNIVVQP